MHFCQVVKLMLVKNISYKDAKKILGHPEIYDVITNDNAPPIEDYEPPKDCQYIGGFVKDDLIAVMVYHQFRESIKCHVQVLPTHRADHAMEFGKLALSLKDGLTIYADIPRIYPNVLKFAELFGFKIIDIIADSGIKNGESFDSYLLRLDNWDSSEI